MALSYKEENFMTQKSKSHSLKITFIVLSILILLGIILLLYVPTIQAYHLYTKMEEKRQELSASSNLYYEVSSHYLTNSTDTGIVDNTTKVWYRDGICLKDNGDRFLLIH